MAALKSLIKRYIPARLFKQLAPTWHLLVAVVANMRFGFPSKHMHVIGVTGTNGKTTTAFMIHTMLTQAGYRSGLMTTVAYGVGNDISPQVAHMTTASAPLLQKRLAEFKKQGVEWVVLETTSHALAQHRTWGIPYEIAVMTNITHEHLDYHGSFQHYLQAKLRLFHIAAQHGRKLAVINGDDENAKVFLDSMPRSIAYGINSGQLIANSVTLGADGSHYEAVIGNDTYTIHCKIPGEFNVYNSLAAVAVGRELGLSRDQIEMGIAALEGVEGRMDVIDEGQAFTVIVDFAHTPDSFERLLHDVRQATKGKLIILFGSAGRRDETKRAIQGEIAGRFGDVLILTEEDDRDVDGNAILQQIADGAAKSGKVQDKDMMLILDRSEAIKTALSLASAQDDTVILLGNCHEKTIERADGEYPWNEAEAVRGVLRQIVKQDGIS